MTLAVIGGMGLYQLSGLVIEESRQMSTPYGDPSAPVVRGKYHGRTVHFLARHGEKHQWPAHRVNYRANVHALKQLGMTQIIAVNTVGGITQDMESGALCVPDQIIDYTWDRKHTYSDDEISPLNHVEFSTPYAENTRQLLIDSGREAGLNLVKRGVYGCTQGPRLETIAEIQRMRRDGCDVVGMTGMPEAALARELGMDYASLCLIVNWAAGCSSEVTTMDAINAVLKAGMEKVHELLKHSLDRDTKAC